MTDTNRDSVQQRWLRGAYDLHVHSAPDLMDRIANDYDLAEAATNVGMAGFVLKSHYAPTAERAWLIRRSFPEVFVVGAVVLNHFVGGINALAVEALARAGGRVVFMPTSDAENEKDLLEDVKQSGRPLAPYLQIKEELQLAGRLRAPISLLGEDGRLTADVYEVLEVVADYGLLLATGHIGWQEMRHLVPECMKRGVERVLVTHPESPSINLSTEQQQFLASSGAYFERCFAYLTEAERFQAAVEGIKATGAQRNVLSSDLGAVGRPHPQAGMGELIGLMASQGFSDGEIAVMTQSNPAALLGRG